jgi:hypothetical protein
MKTQSIAFNLGLAAFMIAASAALVAAKSYGLIGGEVPLRGTMVLIGLVMVFQSNLAAKYETKYSARVQRFAGWAGVVSGLAYTVIWAFAPLKIAAFASMAPVLIAFGLVYFFCVTTRRKTA